MSTTYHFIDPVKKREATALFACLKTQQDALIGALLDHKKAHPEAADLADEHIQLAKSSPVFWSDEYTQHELRIGVMTAAGFKYDASGGIADKRSFLKFARDHPEYAIEDEYADEITTKQFLERTNQI